MAIGNYRTLGAKTVPNLLDKVNRTDIVNDVTSGGTGAPLSAEQGKALKGMIDAESGSRVSGDLAIIGTASSAYNTLGKIEGIVVANKASAEQAITELQGQIGSDIANQISALESADVALGQRIDTEISDRTTAVSNEEQARIAGDNTLDSKITQEISDRQSAINTLDTYVKAQDLILQGNIDSEASARELAISTEASARQSADTTLDNKIDSEIAARTAAVASVQSSLNAEVSNRTNADNALDLRLSAVETGMATGAKFKGSVASLADFDAMTESEQEAGWMFVVDSGSTGSRDLYVVVADQSGDHVPSSWTAKSLVWLMDYSDVTNVVTIERTQRVSADAQLQNNIDTLSGVVDSNKTLTDGSIATLRSDMENAVANEATARTNGDDALQTAIDAEITNRQTAVSAVEDALAIEVSARENAITTEATARQVADAALQANIDAEATARANAVTAEATARSSADATLNAKIDTEIAQRQSAVSSEEAARIAGDDALDARLDVIEGDELTSGSVRKALKDAKAYADMWIPIPALEGQDGSLLVVGDTVTTVYAPYRGVQGIAMGEVILYAPDGQSMFVSVSNVVGNVLTLAVGTTGEYAGWNAKVQYWFVNADQGGSGVGVSGEGGAGA